MFSGAVSPTHILIVLLIFVLLFGAKKLPEAARGLGRSARIFKAEIGGLQDDEAKREDEAKRAEAKPSSDA